MKGAIWFGVLLLVVMFVGVTILVRSSHSADQAKTDADANAALDKVVAWGYFDGEKGVAGLDPRQYGNVLEIAAENSQVKKGDILLRIDDKLAKLKVEAAQRQLTEAKLLTRLYELQGIEQKAAVAAVEREATAQINRLKNTGSDAQVKEAQALFADKKQAADAKLKQIELQNAPLKIAQAETQVKEAEAALEYFQVVAPDDGIVLRANVRKGETLGPNPMRHAIEFLPTAPIIVKAEVMQEWGRFIARGQDVTIEDDIFQGPKWEGTVKTISEWYAPTRSPVIEPFRMNDVRTLECLIELKKPGNVGQPDHARIGQRVRAKIHIGKQAEKK